MAQHIIRSVRITNSGKLTDRYVTAQVKEASDLDKRAFGRLFVIVELTSPWFPSAQLGQTIINTLAREYFKSTETELLTRFEGALKKVNETLGQLAATSEQNLGETLHAAVLLAAGDQLHCASTGGGRAWLVRDGSAAPLLGPSKGASSPSKTFGSVLSGALEPGDRVIATSSGILSVLSDSELATNVFAAHDFATAAIRLTMLLRSKRGQWVNALMVEYQDEARASSLPVHPLPDTLYLDTGSVSDWRLTAAQVLGKIRDSAVLTGTLIAQAYAASSHFIKTTVLPKTKALAASSQRLARQGLTDFHEKTLPSLRSRASSLQSGLLSATRKAEPAAAADKSQTGSLIGQSLFAIHDYQGEPEIEADPSRLGGQAEAEELTELPPNDRVRHYSSQIPPAASVEPPATSAFRLPRLKIPSINLSLRSLSIQSVRLGSGQARQVGFIAVVALLLGLLINNLWALQSKRSDNLSRTQAGVRLTELQDKLQEAKLAKIFNQSDKAVAAAETVVAGSADLADSPLASDGAEIAAEAQAVLDDLTGTTRLGNLTELGKIDGTLLALWQDHITATERGGGLVTYPTAGGESASLSLPGGEQLSSLAPFDGKDGFVALSSGPIVYAAAQAAGPLNPLSLSAGSWHAGSAVTAFVGNLYVLAPSQNSIWKYAATNGVFADGQSYVTDGTDVSQGVDLAIDGNVYVLTKSGEILKLNRGKRVELRVRDIPKPGETLSEPKQIETSGDKVYILDHDRIIKLAIDGRYEHQYALADNEPIRAFAIRDKTLFILTDTRLIKTELP